MPFIRTFRHQRDGMTLMDTPEEFYIWFRAEAESLPRDVKLSVLDALDKKVARQVYLGLHPLNEAKKLPASWEPMLAEFYSRFY